MMTGKRKRMAENVLNILINAVIGMAAGATFVLIGLPTGRSVELAVIMFVGWEVTDRLDRLIDKNP